MKYIVKQDKNGKNRYYRIEDGKKKAVKKAEYEDYLAEVRAAAAAAETTTAENTANTKKEDKSMNTNFKQSRWTKVHEQGQGNFESKNNVMDITIGKGRAQADILYSTKMVRTFEKAAYWLLHSLEIAHATDVVALAGDSIKQRAAETGRDDELLAIEGAGWMCTIENMGDGEFKAQLTWTFKDEEAVQTTDDDDADEATEEEAVA